MFKDVLLVGVGGFMGSITRFGTSVLIRSWVNHPWPWATFAINIIGCFGIGLLTAYLEKQTSDPRTLSLLLSTGFLGGFTTFSAFGLETLALYRTDSFVTAALYAASSVILGVGAVFLGRSLSFL